MFLCAKYSDYIVTVIERQKKQGLKSLSVWKSWSHFMLALRNVKSHIWKPLQTSGHWVQNHSLSLSLLVCESSRLSNILLSMSDCDLLILRSIEIKQYNIRIQSRIKDRFTDDCFWYKTRRESGIFRVSTFLIFYFLVLECVNKPKALFKVFL